MSLLLLIVGGYIAIRLIGFAIALILTLGAVLYGDNHNH